MEEFGWARFFAIAFVSGAVVMGLIAFSARRPADVDGWFHVRAGAFYYFGTIVSGALALLMGFLGVSEASTRPDADTQNQIAVWLSLVFAACTLYFIIYIGLLRRIALRWRDNEIIWHNRHGAVEARTISQVTRVSESFFSDAVTAHFDDGTKLRIYPFATNASALIEMIKEHAWLDD